MTINEHWQPIETNFLELGVHPFRIAQIRYAFYTGYAAMMADSAELAKKLIKREITHAETVAIMRGLEDEVTEFINRRADKPGGRNQ